MEINSINCSVLQTNLGTKTVSSLACLRGPSIDVITIHSRLPRRMVLRRRCQVLQSEIHKKKEYFEVQCTSEIRGKGFEMTKLKGTRKSTFSLVFSNERFIWPPACPTELVKQDLFPGNQLSARESIQLSEVTCPVLMLEEFLALQLD